MNIQILIAFFAYFCILLSIGLISHRKQTTSADFIMGNRSLNFWLTALSAHASDMSGWLFMGFPAAIFIGGMSQSWIAWGLIIGMLANWQFVATRLRTATEKYNSYTLSTFFERRYDDTSGTLRILTASISVFFLTCYIAAGLIAMGLLFESVFGIDYYLGMSIATFVAVLYTFIGGFVTVAWTDLFQALFLLVVIIFVPIVAFFQLPEGWTTVIQEAQEQGISLNFFTDTSLDTFLTILFLMSWGLGYMGQPHIVTKFMGIKNPKEMNKSKYLGMSWQMIALFAAGAIGLIGIGFFGQPLKDPQLVFVEMVKTLFNPLIAGFILCAVLAANMSTMDSQVLVCASVLSEDFYKHAVNKKATSKELLLVSRVCVVIVALTALLLAFNKNTTVLEAVRYAWSGLGCAFGPLVLMSLYSTKTTKYGAVAGILIGGIIAGGWQFVNGYITAYTIPSEIPGFFLSLLGIIAVSYLTQEKTAENPIV